MSEPVGSSRGPSAALVVGVFVKVIVALAVVFILVRILAPTLMDYHNDILFWLGAACWPLAIIVAIFAGSWIYRDIRRHFRRTGQIVRFRARH
ncbi:MAG: hypothetical protein P4L64_18445 [Caulobacteraceae bacterium]|nr:hypothetical protein [Caulobacteraceae bacterium]